MTADWYVFPAEVLRRISSRITNEVSGINRVTYDISSKPPAVRTQFHMSKMTNSKFPMQTVEWL